jgi:hypothetical protein
MAHLRIIVITLAASFPIVALLIFQDVSFFHQSAPSKTPGIMVAGYSDQENSADYSITTPTAHQLRTPIPSIQGSVETDTPTTMMRASAQTATTTPVAPWVACEGSPPSRLRVGDIAYVSYNPPYSNRVREIPNWNTGTIIGLIPPGTRIEIISGPECTHNVVWWKVRVFENDLIGWTVEGDQNDYWLVPETQL